MGSGRRPPGRTQCRLSLRVARDDRRRRPGPARPLGAAPRVRCPVDPDRDRGRLGAVPLRPLGLGAALGLDLGGRCTLGLCTFSLRPLGELARPLGLVPGHLRGAARVCACAGGLGGRPAAGGVGFHRLAGRGLGAAGAARGLRAPLPAHTGVRWPREFAAAAAARAAAPWAWPAGAGLPDGTRLVQQPGRARCGDGGAT